MAQCPVCGKQVDEKNWLQTGGDIWFHEGKTFYFCGLQHKMKFNARPEAFIQKTEKRETK